MEASNGMTSGRGRSRRRRDVDAVARCSHIRTRGEISRGICGLCIANIRVEINKALHASVVERRSAAEIAHGHRSPQVMLFRLLHGLCPSPTLLLQLRFSMCELLLSLAIHSICLLALTLFLLVIWDEGTSRPMI